MKISFVIVNYNTRELLGNCISSILGNAKSVEFEVIVVNNEKKELSRKDLMGRLERSDFDLKFVEMGQNVGFGRACNAGVSDSGGDVLCFLNPDAKVVSGNLQEVVQYLNKEPKAGIAGPKILEKNGKIQSWSAGKEFGLMNLILNHLKGEKKDALNQVRRKDWVTGAAFFIKKDIFDSIGGFDERFFLYYEDMDLCKRIRLSGRSVVYFPCLVVEHSGGKGMDSRDLQKRLYYESQDYYFEKHFGRKKKFFLKIFRSLYLQLKKVKRFFVGNKLK